MHDDDNGEDEETDDESLKNLTSDSIHTATHHWHWIDAIVHILRIVIVVVASRMKLMNVADLEDEEEWVVWSEKEKKKKKFQFMAW